jgi:atypical dual specificity phosphatase
MSSHYNNLWWALDGVLAGMGMPYVDSMRRLSGGGELAAYADELPTLYRAGVRAVVCLLNIPSDFAVFQSAGFEFKCLPINDGQPPNNAQAREFIEFVDSCRPRKLPVAVFCEAGAGRTGTMIACYLVHSGLSAAEAIAHVRSKEPSAVERVQQIMFLEQFERQQRDGR